MLYCCATTSGRFFIFNLIVEHRMLDGEPLLLVRDVPGVDLGATDAALQGRDRAQVRIFVFLI